MLKVGNKHQIWTVLATAYKMLDNRQSVVYLGESDNTYKIWHMFADDDEFARNPHYWPKSDTPDKEQVMRMFTGIVVD